MVSDIATATAEPRPAAPAPAEGQAAAPPAATARPRRRPRISPLTRRILAVNVLALGLLGLGLLYLGEYQLSLVAAQLDALSTQGQIIADIRVLRGPGGVVHIKELPPPGEAGPLPRLGTWLYDSVIGGLSGQQRYPPYREPLTQTAADYAEVERALRGDIGDAVRSEREGAGLVLSVAVPVQRYKQVLGAVLLSSDSSEIEQAVRSVRFQILKVFCMALGVTVLLSIYLAGTIARPIRRLAAAAERVRRGHGRQVLIPDFTRRGDEIGDLSGALREMTSALWRRIVAIEPVMIGPMLETLVDVHQSTAGDDAPRLVLALPGPVGTPQGDLPALGVEGRLVQVFRNLIVNALSFSPRGAAIHISARRDGDAVAVAIEDEGPGIPENKLEAIFERFYSERPVGEKFGTHSGLGLSISKQIIEAHRGTIGAENRRDADGRVIGARFVVRLPVK